MCGADGADGRCAGENGAGGGVDGGMLGREAQRRWKWPRGRRGLMGESQESESESESESSESVHGEKKLRRVEEVGVAEARKVPAAAEESRVRVGFWRRGGVGEGVMVRVLGL